jgi:hypothetical protein
MEVLNFVAGLTICQAIQRAKDVASESAHGVLVDINDIQMLIKKDTNTKKALIEYSKKLEFKNEIEKIKRQR